MATGTVTGIFWPNYYQISNQISIFAILMVIIYLCHKTANDINDTVSYETPHLAFSPKFFSILLLIPPFIFIYFWKIQRTINAHWGYHMVKDPYLMNTVVGSDKRFLGRSAGEFVGVSVGTAVGRATGGLLGSIIGRKIGQYIGRSVGTYTTGGIGNTKIKFPCQYCGKLLTPYIDGYQNLNWWCRSCKKYIVTGLSLQTQPKTP